MDSLKPFRRTFAPPGRSRDTLGIPSIWPVPVGELAPVASKAAAYARIDELLGEGRTHLPGGRGGVCVPVLPGICRVRHTDHFPQVIGP